MQNDKIFAAYTVTLIALIGSAVTASVMAGMATIPSAGIFLEHLALSLTLRGAYKSFAGFDWFFVTARAAGFITQASELATPDMPDMGAAASA